ncbi:MAG: hypothetical protein HON23_05230 [Rickettsiales bacterium]|nr:hypothetical protein [Rickettsiales bacterium]
MTYKFSNLHTRLDKSVDLIHQFCALVDTCYQGDLNLHNFKMNPWDVIFDNSAHPVIIMSKQEVIGGSILYVRSLSDKQKLPLEQSSHMDLTQIIKDTGIIINNNICEISKISVKPKYRDRRITQEVIGIIIAKAVRERCDSLFAITTPKTSRNVNIACNKLGVPYSTIYHDIPDIPLYKGLTIDLTRADLTQLNLSKLTSNCHFSKLVTEMCDISYRETLSRITLARSNIFLNRIA